MVSEGSLLNACSQWDHHLFLHIQAPENIQSIGFFLTPFHDSYLSTKWRCDLWEAHLLSNDGDFGELLGQWSADTLLCQPVCECLQIISASLGTMQDCIISVHLQFLFKSAHRAYVTETQTAFIPFLQSPVLQCEGPSSLLPQPSLLQCRQRPKAAWPQLDLKTFLMDRAGPARWN